MTDRRESHQAVAKKASGSLKSSDARPWTGDEQAALAEAMGLMLDGQKQFGKKPEQLENIVKLFCWVLKPYSIELVMAGLSKYMAEHSDIPTPSDIVKIIDPKPPEWRPDKAYYIRLQQIYKEQGPYGLDTDEIEYIRRYESHMKRELKEAS
jgi:hypothetical protein